MSHDQNLDVRGYVDILLRHMWLILITTLVIPLMAYAFTWTISNRFTSQTLVLVDQKKVPENLVKPAVTGEINDALVNLPEQILSRTRLESIIDRFGLFKSEQGRATKDVLVERLREMVEVTPLKGGASGVQGGASGFHISIFHTIISNMNSIHNQNLPIITWVRKNFLVTGHARVKAYFAGGCANLAKSVAIKNVAIC